MSLTSYRAAPPRDKLLRAFEKTGTETNWAHAQGRRSIPSGGFLRRRPGQMPLGASRMYQRKAALERPAIQLLRFYDVTKRPNRPSAPLLPESAQKPSVGTQKAGKQGAAWRIRSILWRWAAVPAAARSPAGFPRIPGRRWRCWKPAALTTTGS